MENAGLRACAVSGLFLVCSGMASAATLTVTSVNDSGAGSLRECMTVANSNSGADTIVFNIPGPGVHTIAPTSPLPPLTDAAGVTIDGYTQPGAHPNTLAIGNDAVLIVELDGALAGTNADGLDLRSPATTIRGLLINGFDRNGIAIRKGDVRVAGCFVGIDPSGTTARPNRFGISTFPLDPKSPAPVFGVTIGGLSPGDRNVVSGNLLDGVIIFNASGTAILGNYVGTNAAGDAAVPNGSSGIVVNSSIDSRVGGTGAGARNILSGNLGPGVTLYFAGGSAVEGNLIGTNAAGAAFLPNSTGVWVFSSQDSSIGDGTSSARNVIAGNRRSGIQIFGATTFNNLVSGNSIRDNGGSGIDLGGDGVSPNDSGDMDDGPNLLQNFPVLASATSVDGTTTISGTLNSILQTQFRIEFFANDACDASGFGEGTTFLGSTDVTTDVSGNASFATTVKSTAGQFVTATATDPEGNTSEFSACQIVTAAQHFFTLPSCRVIDTRNPDGALGGPALSGQSGRTFALAGTCGIPATAKSVAANLTVTQPAAQGHLTTHPAGTGIPLASTINFSAGQTRANNAILELSMDGSGSVSVENAAAGPVHLVLDVSGYFE